MNRASARRRRIRSPGSQAEAHCMPVRGLDCTYSDFQLGATPLVVNPITPIRQLDQERVTDEHRFAAKRLVVSVGGQVGQRVRGSSGIDGAAEVLCEACFGAATSAGGKGRYFARFRVPPHSSQLPVFTDLFARTLPSLTPQNTLRFTDLAVASSWLSSQTQSRETFGSRYASGPTGKRFAEQDILGPSTQLRNTVCLCPVGGSLRKKCGEFRRLGCRHLD